jgi:hypothetical protein
MMPRMKRGVFILLFTGCLAALAAKPKPAAPSKPAAPAGNWGAGTKEQDLSKPAEVVEKPKAFTVTATEMSGSSFMSTEKGARVTNTMNSETVIQQGAKPAKASDLQEGDVITGTRKQVSDTEYAVVKITKFVHKKAEEKK